jgi:two-component system cell cycle response regulator
MALPGHPTGDGTASWSIAPGRDGGERRPYLIVLSGPQLGDMFPLETERECVLGRDPACDVRLRDTGVSRRHASILFAPGGARLRDLGSTNGVFVEGVRITDCVLVDGQRMQMGMHTSLKYCLCDELEIEYQRRLAEGALLDPATGLFNRRHFEDRLSSELAAVERVGRPMSVLLAAVDDVPRLVATHGAPAGEEFLALVARDVRAAVRRDDVLARIGEQELGVVSRETPLSAGRALGERIRKWVGQGRVTIRGLTLVPHVSVGVVSVDSVGRYDPPRTERAVLDAAEDAFRRARAAGGDRVVAEGPLDLP